MTQSPPEFLTNGGEMGERIRAFDWSQTPLGPRGKWSPTLKMMVRFLLANRFPHLLWWGPEFIQIYNDPYRPILGAKHPSPGLGRSVKECWSEIWHILQPLIETPFNGGPSTWMEDIFLELHRHGFVEETHFTIAYSPVPDETVPGGIGGVLATVHEITEKVIGERRVVVLRDLGARVGEAKTAEEACAIVAQTLAGHNKDIPFVLLYLIDPDRKTARLAETVGVPANEAISPTRVDLTREGDGGWPLVQACRTETMQVVDNLKERFGKVPAGPWSDPPDTAVVVTIPSHKAHEPAGILIAGISARIKLDAFYRDFIELVRTQVSTSIANARAYEEERRRAEALSELDRAKTAFFSNVSHEFRTPLTLMLGPLEETLGKVHGELPPEVEANLEVAHRNGLRLLRLVNNLLDFSRIEAGRIDASYEPTDLSTVTAEIASVFRSAIEKAGLRLVVDCPPLPEHVYVDREMWEKIVLNLLSNAFKFTFEGEINVALRCRGDHVELSVRDSGVGIPSSELKNIFVRFHRVRGGRSRTHEGTGIGLALVQELARLHGGDAKVESKENSGSTFTVTILTGKRHLPADRVDGTRTRISTSARVESFTEEALDWIGETASPTALTNAQVLSEQGPPSNGHLTRCLRILLADDNADMRAYVRGLLAPNYEVEAAPNGQAALEIARERIPDLVLTDVMMPILDGFGLLNELRADERTRTIPVILLSARAGEEARLEGLDAGADDYLVKPFSARELLARVRSQLDMARMRRQTEQEVTRVLQSITDGFQVLDSKGRFTHMNEAARKMLAAHGADADKLIGKHIFNEGFPEARGTIIDRELTRAMDERVAVEFETFYEPWQRCYHVRAYPIEQGGISIYYADVTDRKRIEEALRDSEQRFRALVTTTSDIVYRMSPDWTEMRYLHGRKLIRDTQEPSRAWLDHYIPKEDQPLVRLAAEQAIRTEGIFELEHRIIRADGTLGWIFSRAIPLRDDSGRIVEWFGAASDITDRKQNEERLERIVEHRTLKLRETVHELESYSYSISHDMRAPLRAIQAYSQVLLDELGPRLDDSNQRYLSRIMAGANRMDKLITDVLSYSRLARGDIVLKPVSLDQLVEEITYQYPTLQSADIDTADHLGTVVAAEALLSQAIANLLTNAAKFVASGARPRIKIWSEESTLGTTPALKLFVKDHGIGIAPENQQRIFGIFNRVHTEKQYEGTGIGLSIVRKAVQRMNGEVGLSSALDHGATFWLELPKA